MQGQWLGEIKGDFPGTIRLEIEARSGQLVGAAYLFYERPQNLPGLMFLIQMPLGGPYTIEVDTEYLYTDGGLMSRQDRVDCERDLQERFGQNPIPARYGASFTSNDKDLTLTWDDGEKQGQIELTSSEHGDDSEIVGRADMREWDQFRSWAINQKPRQYIFRGQTYPHKLASTFHRTWRKDIQNWVNSDVRQVFGAIIDKVNYPLQLGNTDHNSAIWSILQHHGYPTPMLDWTFSPFVAAFFAFHNIDPEQNKPARIFIFDRNAWDASYARSTIIPDLAPPQIVVLESLHVGNPRSSPQQALATVTNIADVEEFIRKREQIDKKSYLTVCDLQIDERPKIMRELELMGITYGSLFPGLDGICRDMKDRMFAQPA